MIENSTGKFFETGTLLEIKNNYRIELFTETDPTRRFYPRTHVYGPSLMLVLDLCNGERMRSNGDSVKIVSYKVLTEQGTGHVCAYTNAYQYSYYEEVT